MNRTYKDMIVNNILTKIEETENLLNQMFKAEVSFSFSKNVFFKGYHINILIENLIVMCSEFITSYKQNTNDKKLNRRYEPIYWWYRFGIAKDNEYFKRPQIESGLYVKMQDFKHLMRQKYYKKPRKRNDEGQKDYYEFSEKEFFKIPLLESIGMIWDKEEEKWLFYYPLLCRYYKDMEHSYVTSTYITKDGFHLGYWVSHIINSKDGLLEDKIKLLEAVEFPYKHLKIGGTSFWEQALYYYIRQWYTDAKNRTRDYGYELDIFIRDPKIAIEYDGYYSHRKEENYQRDMEKDKCCVDDEIEIIRVREYGLKATKQAKNFFLNKRKFSFEDFDRVAREVLSYVCHTEMLPIDTIKYRDEIIRQYCNLRSLPQYKNFKKIIDYYNQHLEWPTKSSNYELWKLMCLFRNAKKGKNVGLISKSWIDELERTNFPFDPYNERFEKFMAHVQRFCELGGDINNIEKDFVEYYDGTRYNLGSQLNHIKWRHPDNIKGYGTKKGRELTPEQVDRLNKFNLDWRTSKKKTKT